MKPRCLNLMTPLVKLVIACVFLFNIQWPLITQAQTQTRSRQLEQTGSIRVLPDKNKRWALVIGVDQYQDSGISRLNGAANDAKRLASALVQYAGFPDGQVILLSTDEPPERQPTQRKILRYLSNLRGLVPKDGLLLVAFSGHGVERGGRAFLLPADTESIDDLSLLEDTAVGVERVKEQIRATGVGQVILILDACRNDPAAGRSGGDNPLTAGFSRSFNFDARNVEVQAFVTLYATAIGQRAYEYSEKKQGYFTWALIEGLKGAAANNRGEVTLGRLLSYAQETVPQYVRRDLGANKQQKPFAIIEGYRAEELVIAIAAKTTETAIDRPAARTEDSAEVVRQPAKPELKNEPDTSFHTVLGKDDLYQKFIENYKTNQPVAYEFAKVFLRQYPNVDPKITQYLNNYVKLYEEAFQKIQLQKYVTGKNYSEAFTLGKQILASEPDNLSVLMNLGYAGYNAAYSKNTAFNSDAINYAKQAIQMIESGKATESWAPFINKDEALAYLNYALGFLNLETNKGEAIGYFAKAIQNETIKNEPMTYFYIAYAYEAGPYKTESDAIQVFQGKPETPESKAALERLNQLIDRLIDAYARAVAYAGTRALYQADKTRWMQRLTELYKFRHDNSDAGLNELVAGVRSTPLPDPPQF